MNLETKMSNPKKLSFGFWSQVKTSVILIALTATTILVGAWCPQESQVGKEKVFEAFGQENGQLLINLGVADTFHSPWFLFLIAMLSLSMLAASFERVFPRLLILKNSMPLLGGAEITKLPYHRQITRTESGTNFLDEMDKKLQAKGFKTQRQGDRLLAEYGKISRLAPSVTHVGLLSLLVGVTITSWTGFNGFQPVRLGECLNLADSQHSKLWIGKLPKWQARVVETRRENHPTGEPKQWYTTLEIEDQFGKVLKKGELSVNNPLTFEDVDIYQSSWGIDSISLKFNGQKQEIPVNPMGKRFAAFLPLDKDSVMIFSVLDQKSELRIFAKQASWDAPKLLAEVGPGATVDLGGVKIEYEGIIPRTGLQYKKDPGIFVVYTAFGFIIAGVMLAFIPHRHVWLCKENDGENENLYAGGRSPKAKMAFQKMMDKMLDPYMKQTPATKEQEKEEICQTSR